MSLQSQRPVQDDPKLSLSQGEHDAQTACTICKVTGQTRRVSSIIDATMGNLRTAGAEGCQLCELAFKCVATHDGYVKTSERLDQTVSLNLTQLNNVPSRGDHSTQLPTVRRVKMNPSFVPDWNKGLAANTRRDRNSNAFLTIYADTFQAQEYCRLSSKGTPIEVEVEKSPRGIASNANSLQCFQLIDQWIKNCLKNHPACAPPWPPIPVQLPTRVLDIGGPKDGNKIRLVDAVGLSGRYVALSHCWGGGYVPKTLSICRERR